MKPEDISRWLRRLSFLCGVVPPCAGASIFFLWLLTGHPGLVIAGVATLIGGAVSLLLGAILLAFRVPMERSLGAAEAALARERRLGGIMLLANLPVAALLVAAVFVSSESYSVSIRNRGQVALDDFTIVDQGRSERHDFGSFAPGDERTVAVHIKGRTALTFEMVRFGQVSTGTITGQTEPDLAADQWSTVTVGDDGRALVEESGGPGP